MCKEKLNITVENSCFDYIEDVLFVNGETVINCFVEPCGYMWFSTKKENYIELLENLFNAQPKEYDYIKAGWVLKSNISNPLINTDLEDINLEELWDDKIFNLHEEKNNFSHKEIKTVEQLYQYLYHEKSEYNKLCVRFDSFLLEKDWREGLISHIVLAKYLTKDTYLFVFDERDTAPLNKNLGIETNEIIQDSILKGSHLLSEIGLTLFLGNEFDEIKKEWNEYLEHKEKMDFEDFLDMKRKKKNN